jgi:membrane protein YdbS with pleckstrin-like domain
MWSENASPEGTSTPSDSETPAVAGGAQSVAIDVDEYTTGPRSLSASVQVIWALRALVVVGILGGIAVAVASRFEVSLTYVGSGVVALAVVALVWVHLRHRIWTYRVREDALYLERGVLTRVNTVVPYVRIQHVDTQRGPLERLLGLSTLVVYTAGSRGADVSVPGLTTTEAADLQGRVKDLAIETEGGDAL